MRNKIIIGLTLLMILIIGSVVRSNVSQAKTINSNKVEILKLNDEKWKLENETTSRAKEIESSKQTIDQINQQLKDSQLKIDQLNKQLSAKKAAEAANKAVSAVVSAKVVYPAGCEIYRPLVAQYGWNVESAMAVMKAESGCNPMAANLTDSHATCKGSFGLFQIACFDGQVFDPVQNVAIAWRKYVASGWRPWGVAPKLGLL